MLYGPLGSGKPKRVQGCFITDEEVEEVAEFVKSSSDSDYSEEILKEIEQNATSSSSGGGKADSDGDQMAMELDGDELLPDAVEVILDTKQASVSMLQRRLKLGYAHAARIVDEMEEKGIVGPFEGSKPRQLLITREQWDTMVGINPRAKAPEAAQEPVPEEADDPPFDL
jgi:S-DNA-T family DNA segregation ATPase FtsK/SpoIIIE